MPADTAAGIRITDITMATDGSASAAFEVASICPTMQEFRAAAAKQAVTCVAGVSWCRGVEGVSPYVGIRIGGMGNMEDR